MVKGGGEDGGIARIPGTSSARSPDYEKWWLSQVYLSPPEGLTQYAEMLPTLDIGPFISQKLPPVLILAPAKIVATPLKAQYQIAQKVPPRSLVAFYGQGHEIDSDKTDTCIFALLKVSEGPNKNTIGSSYCCAFPPSRLRRKMFDESDTQAWSDTTIFLLPFTDE